MTLFGQSSQAFPLPLGSETSRILHSPSLIDDPQSGWPWMSRWAEWPLQLWTLLHPTQNTVDEPPHQICSYTLLFSLFLHFLYIVDPPLCTSTPTRPHALTLARQSHSLYRTNLAYLMDIWLTIHMYLLLFLVSPMCPLLWSDQSQALAPHGQALFLTSPYAHIIVYHSYLTCLYLPFTQNIITEALTNCLYE